MRSPGERATQAAGCGRSGLRGRGQAVASKVRGQIVEGPGVRSQYGRGRSEDWKWRVEGAGKQVEGGSTHGSSLPSLSQVLQTA